ncbi:UDP-N-acetylmuramate dehydrogenase [Maribacter algicola]|uniref:UDP-N-acetylenolpyruvoylglucosamine reductase n=1 Tax=Maribacter algicola TaxID=2498892 RepID=A0A3R8RXQ1_9FLAO|nr:UDP-N-acetylmuramate dehydrogenase [Maribacter algicola]RRQ47765.1 UDP-N-acetylmuramate dehydrogenase [Maribacter algicola]
MEIYKNYSLKDYNTFGIDAKAKFFIEINSVQELQDILADDTYQNKFILGGGSNMLITQDIDALVIYVNIKGIHIQNEDEDFVKIKVMAGENWHEMVLWTLENNFGGLENMSLIPGNTGTAPIQNIGAYGVELKDVFVSCEAIRMADQKLVHFTKEECQFGYRDSFFKNEGKDQYVITSVTLKLTKKNHVLNTNYGAISEELARNNNMDPSIVDISNAVITIRNSKLPNPKELGNSGSFFKNPVISKEVFEDFIAKNPEAPFYKVSEEEFKIPAGWLIEQSGYKGKRFGDAGVHKKQALVLVNYGNAKGLDILNLAHKIIADVKSKFGITIQPEVNLIK